MIVWRESPDMPMQNYELNTVTYGAAPADIFKDVYPLGSSVIANDFYVDELLSGR